MQGKEHPLSLPCNIVAGITACGPTRNLLYTKVSICTNARVKVVPYWSCLAWQLGTLWCIAVYETTAMAQYYFVLSNIEILLERVKSSVTVP